MNYDSSTFGSTFLVYNPLKIYSFQIWDSQSLNLNLFKYTTVYTIVFEFKTVKRQ